MEVVVADIITSRKMRALEKNAEYFAVSRVQLMENAGRSVASEVSKRFQPGKTRVVIFCGLGGNGGDGFAAARHLLTWGYHVKVVVAGKTSDIKDEAALRNQQALRPLLSDVSLFEVEDSAQAPDIDAHVVVDALLGCGLKGIPRQPVLELVRKINQMDAFRLAVDVPTGVDSDSGEVSGEAVKADLTVTFYKAKPGLLEASDYVGDLLVNDIGLPEAFEGFVGPGDVCLVVRDRPAESHKGDFGKLLVVGGSETFSGAPILVALSAFRTGVDLVYIAAPGDTASAIKSMTPNPITVKLEGPHLSPQAVSKVKQYLEKSTAAVVGPGLGLHSQTKTALKDIVAAAETSGTPLVLDADGLKAYAEFKRPLATPLVLTPHTKEFSILTGKKLPSNLEERKRTVRKAAAKLNAVILLKGATDIISDGKRVKLNFTGNPGMTVGGTGDVLSGVVGALLAQRADPFEAAAASAFITGAAGDFVKNEKGYHMIPTDLLEWIPKIIDDPISHLKVQKGAP